MHDEKLWNELFSYSVNVFPGSVVVAYLKVGVQNPASASDPEKFWEYPLLENAQFEPPIGCTYATVKTI